jgi:hypothetical protein
MNKHLKAFILRGLIFGGFGPIILAIVYFILGFTIDGFSLTGKEVFSAIISIYILAFIQAGCSVFNQIEDWPLMKSLFFHFTLLYLAYTGCYVFNSWIEFNAIALLIFTLVFVLIYFVTYATVVICIKTTKRRLNERLK